MVKPQNSLNYAVVTNLATETCHEASIRKIIYRWVMFRVYVKLPRCIGRSRSTYGILDSNKDADTIKSEAAYSSANNMI